MCGGQELISRSAHCRGIYLQFLSHFFLQRQGYTASLLYYSAAQVSLHFAPCIFHEYRLLIPSHSYRPMAPQQLERFDSSKLHSLSTRASSEIHSGEPHLDIELSSISVTPSSNSESRLRIALGYTPSLQYSQISPLFVQVPQLCCGLSALRTHRNTPQPSTDLLCSPLHLRKYLGQEKQFQIFVLIES